MSSKSYSELMSFETFEDRFKYLQTHSKIGVDTFGFDRYLNQKFYNSVEWKQVRNYVIVRDNGCDLGIPDRQILGKICIHHINPITQEDVVNSSRKLFDPENLICVSQETHNAIHYGDDSIVHKYDVIDRSPNDTSPWRK